MLEMIKFFFDHQFFFLQEFSLEYLKYFENEFVSVAYVKLMPQEETELHYDKYPHQVKSLTGGIITRIEADGSINKIVFPMDCWIFRPAESPEKMHKSINELSVPIEMVIVQLK